MTAGTRKTLIDAVSGRRWNGGSQTTGVLVDKRIKGIQHVGYFVQDIDASVAMFRRLFDMDGEALRSMSAEETAGTGRFSFVPVGDVELELIELLDANVKALCGDPSPGISHIALQVEDIEELVASLAERGFRLGYITKQGIFNNGRSKIAYLEPADTQGYLIELVEPLE
jgi:methylmalonyl-CoA/ethylmalonyl-CoA epimerase